MSAIDQRLPSYRCLSLCVATGLAVAMVMALGGCQIPYMSASPEQNDYQQSIALRGDNDDRYRQAPRMRMGCLPFPGALTLWDTVDLERLGQHEYLAWNSWASRRDEWERGIIYTRQLGFVDLAHVRNVLDMAQHCRILIRDALKEGRTQITLKAAEPTLYHVQLPTLDMDEADPRRAAVIDALAIDLGLRMAHRMATWHEIITWFGYKGWAVIPEDLSAFTWDDPTSHALAMLVGGRAMRDAKHPFEEAVTRELATALNRFQALDAEQTTQAAHAVEGQWWSWPIPLKRMIHFGLDGEPLVLWRLDDTIDATHWRELLAPDLSDVQGRDFSAAKQVSIEPRIFEADAIRQAIGLEATQFIEVNAHWPLLQQALREQMRESLGPGADRQTITDVVEASVPKPSR